MSSSIKLSPVAFGRVLVETGDLDPLYLTLNAAKLDWATLARFSLAYWMFYHAGVAARLAPLDADAFWEEVDALLPGAPRGTERRHFRGANAVASVLCLAHRFPEPELAADWAGRPEGARTLPGGFLALDTVMDRVQTWKGFGPWIAFKVADMIDGVLGVPVAFSPRAFFDSPADGARIVFETLFPEEPLPSRNATNAWAVDYFLDALGDLHCPHADRPLRVQEVETILCKYKSYLSGHYPPGKDTTEMLHALRDPQWGPLARTLRAALADSLIGRLPS